MLTTTSWALVLLVCVGPIVLGLIFVFLHNLWCRRRELERRGSANVNEPYASEERVLRDEKQWRRAYAHAAS